MMVNSPVRLPRFNHASSDRVQTRRQGGGGVSCFGLSMSLQSNKARESVTRDHREASALAKSSSGVRSLGEETPPLKTLLGGHEAIEEAIGLSALKLARHRVSAPKWSSAGPSPVLGDRVQLAASILTLLQRIEAWTRETDGQIIVHQLNSPTTADCGQCL